MALPVNITLNFGYCYRCCTDEDKINFTLNYDKYDYIAQSGYSFFYFDIDQIFYSEANEYIESLKIIYRNKKTGDLIALVETPEPEKTELIQNIKFKRFEKIINAKIWLKNDTLIGLEIKTNCDRIIKIGSGKKGEEKNIPEFENDRKIILGFGVYATKKRVTSIYFYFTDREEYLKNYNFSLLELRTKLKLNKQFKENVEKRKNELNEKNKLLVEVCELPEAAFFCIASYFSSY